jgi:hypothetical protein
MIRIDFQTFMEKCLIVSFVVVLLKILNNVQDVEISSVVHALMIGEKKIQHVQTDAQEV